jgi:hypothetical protein
VKWSGLVFAPVCPQEDRSSLHSSTLRDAQIVEVAMPDAAGRGKSGKDRDTVLGFILNGNGINP